MAAARAERFLPPPVVAPPTAGLPLRLTDLAWPGTLAAADLGAALARFLDVEAVQIECSGTSALIVALTALQRLAPQRREVIVPAYTCPLVALAVRHCGLELRLCDLQPDALDLDLHHLRQLCGAQTLAVMPTHLGGRVVDVAGAMACARNAGAWVIEDAAQALGARVSAGADSEEPHLHEDGTSGRTCRAPRPSATAAPSPGNTGVEIRASVGTTGDIGFFSLAVGKGLTTFEGGALVVRDPALREACRQASADTVAPHAGWELRRSLELLGYAALYCPLGLNLAYGRPLRQALRRGDRVAAAGDDFNFPIPRHRMGRWRQAVGVRALARLPAFLADGTARAVQRRARFECIPGLRVLGDSAAVPGAAGVWPVLLVLLPTRAQRDRALDALWPAGCGVSLPFVQALPDYPRYADVVPHASPAELPNARHLAGRMLAISNSAWLADPAFESLCRALEKLLAHPAKNS